MSHPLTRPDSRSSRHQAVSPASAPRTADEGKGKGISPQDKADPDSRTRPSTPASTRMAGPPPSSYVPSVGSRRGGRRESISSRQSTGSSIPVRAYMSPHPPSIVDSQKTAYHMRDPYVVVHGGRNSRGRDRDGMSRHSRANRRWWRSFPIHGWCFFVGFICPPAWWVASFVNPRSVVVSRMKDGGHIEEWNTTDNEALVWRFRCRLLSVLTLFLYIPIIVLAIVFGH